MSVTIVSTQARPAQATTSDNTAVAGNAASGDASGFAGVLRGQLKPASPAAHETAQEATGTTDTTVAEAPPSDAATLLATLGLIPQQPGRKADSQQTDDTLPQDKNTGKDENSPIDTPMAVQSATIRAQGTEPVDATKDANAKEPALSGIGKFDKSTPPPLPSSTIAVTDKTKSLDASGNTTIALPEATATEQQPAKLAAATAVAVQTVENAGSQIPRTVHHEVSLSVPTPVRDQGWASDLGQKVVWLANNDKQLAQITLNPPQMGPIEISLSLDKGSASASFTSANSEVRNALETAMPKLREMFASAGIELGQTNVSAESFRQQAENGNANRGPSQWRSDNAILVADSAISPSGRVFATGQGNRMVDIFA